MELNLKLEKVLAILSTVIMIETVLVLFRIMSTTETVIHKLF